MRVKASNMIWRTCPYRPDMRTAGPGAAATRQARSFRADSRGRAARAAGRDNPGTTGHGGPSLTVNR